MKWFRAMARAWNEEEAKSKKHDALEGRATYEFRVYEVASGGWVVQMEVHDAKNWDSKYVRHFVPEHEGDQIGTVITTMMAIGQLEKSK